jgi:hypothetical protein
VKLKKGTRESNFAAAELDLCISGNEGTKYGRGDSNLGRMGERGAILPQKCFEGELVNLELQALWRSEQERDVLLPSEAMDEFSGEWEK